MPIDENQITVLQDKIPRVNWRAVADCGDRRSFLVGIEVYRLLYEAATKSGFECRTWDQFLAAFGPELKMRSQLPGRFRRQDDAARKYSLSRRTHGLDPQRTLYFPDEMVRVYLFSTFVDADAGQLLAKAPDDIFKRILCLDWENVSERYEKLAIKDSEADGAWASAVEGFANAVEEIWDANFDSLLRDAYGIDGVAITQTVPQYISVDPGLPPMYIYKECKSYLNNDGALPRTRRIGGLCDSIERLFYELGDRDIEYSQGSLSFDSHTYNSYYSARWNVSRNEFFLGGGKLSYSCSYENRLLEQKPKEGCPDKGFLVQFILDEPARNEKDGGTCITQAQGPNQRLSRAECFDVEGYLSSLTDCAYYSQLAYRGGSQGPSIRDFNTLGYTSRYLRKIGEADDLGSSTESDILHFDEGVQLHFLCSGAGRGKTSLVRAIVMALATQDEELCRRMGFSTNDDRLAYIPFSMSFNPYPYEYGKPVIHDGNYLELIESLIMGSGSPAFDVPETKDLDEILDKLCASQKVLFIIDAFDEADDWGKATRAIADLKSRYQDAKILVTSRILSEMPNFTRSRSCIWSLEPMDETQKNHLITSYLDEYHHDVERDARDAFARNLIDDRFCSDLIEVPVFASMAVIGWRGNAGDSRTIVPYDVCDGTVRRLLEKARDVVSKHFYGQGYRLTDVDSMRLVSRLALITFLIQEGLIEDLRSLGLFEGHVRYAGIVPVGKEDFSCLMDLLCREIGLDGAIPATSDFWRRYAIATGVLAFTPDSRGGAFGFEAKDYQIFLAAVGFAELLDHSRDDALSIFDLVINKRMRNNSDICKFITMCFTTTLKQFQSFGLEASMTLLNRLVARIRLTEDGEPGTSDEYDSLVFGNILEILGDISMQRFGPTNIARFDLLEGTCHPYSSFVDCVTSALRDWLATDLGHQLD